MTESKFLDELCFKSNLQAQICVTPQRELKWMDEMLLSEKKKKTHIINWQHGWESSTYLAWHSFLRAICGAINIIRQKLQEFHNRWE